MNRIITAAAIIATLMTGNAMADSKTIPFETCRDAVVAKLVIEGITLPAISSGVEMARNKNSDTAEAEFLAIVSDVESDLAQAEAYIAANGCKLPDNN